jgi:hypothetical protein
MPKRKNRSRTCCAQRLAANAFLGQPVSVVLRWAGEGMPVRRQGRYVDSSREELNRWLGRESAGAPVEIGYGRGSIRSGKEFAFSSKGCERAIVGSANGFRPISDVLWRSIPRRAAQFFQLVETRSTLSDVSEKVCLMNLPGSSRKFQ